MNVTAKWTASTILAALAVGGAGLMACTITTSTVDDTTSSSSSSSGNASSSSSSSGNASSSSGAVTQPDASTCANTNQKSTLNSAACQSCLETNCCSALTGCFDITVDPDGGAGQLDCNGYVDCYDDCLKKQDPDSCIKQDCDGLAAPGVSSAWAQIETCLSTTCKTECQ